MPELVEEHCYFEHFWVKSTFYEEIRQKTTLKKYAEVFGQHH